MLKNLKHIARLIMGAVFVFSGFVKVVDPLGFTYKISDYFEAWGVSSQGGLALVLALLACCGEMLIGLALLFRLRMQVAAWALLAFMSFFTVLTFIVALTNPVTDCGCFGDAIILSNWQTFFKNIIFFIPTIWVFLERAKFEKAFAPLVEWSLGAVLFVAGILLSVYCLRNLPLIDFRPYHVGANIEEGMKVPEGMPVDRYETILVYEKDGVEAEYTLSSPEQPWADSSYTWVASNNVLIEKGYEPPIHDFTLVSADGEDITYQLLSDPGYSLLVVNYDLEKASQEGLQKVNQFAQLANQQGVQVYGMSASLQELVDQVKEKYELTFPYFTTDEITLKTMVRSNPGVLLVKEGTVLAKWHWRNLPDTAFFQQQMLGTSLHMLEKAKNKNLSFLVVMIVLLAGLVVFYFRSRR